MSQPQIDSVTKSNAVMVILSSLGYHNVRILNEYVFAVTAYNPNTDKDTTFQNISDILLVKSPHQHDLEHQAEEDAQNKYDGECYREMNQYWEDLEGGWV